MQFDSLRLSGVPADIYVHPPPPPIPPPPPPPASPPPNSQPFPLAKGLFTVPSPIPQHHRPKNPLPWQRLPCNKQRADIRQTPSRFKKKKRKKAEKKVDGDISSSQEAKKKLLRLSSLKGRGSGSGTGFTNAGCGGADRMFCLLWILPYLTKTWEPVASREGVTTPRKLLVKH